MEKLWTYAAGITASLRKNYTIRVVRTPAWLGCTLHDGRYLVVVHPTVIVFVG